jgi:hypothetical protein
MKLEVTPLPHPSERLDWRGVRKNALQNLEPQGFRGQNLDNRGVRAAVALSACTASALTMICSLSFEVKVGCHKAIAENARFDLSSAFTPCLFARDE